MRFFAQYRVPLLSTSLVIGLAAIAAFGQRANQPATSQSPVERGKYLVTIMDCHGCHTPFKNGQPDMTRMLSGHPQDMKISAAPPTPAGWGMVVAETNTAWSGPWGVSFTSNLTPDPTGIAAWTEETFVNAIRKGKHMGAAVNRDILPPMPWASYANLTDSDIKAIFAYLRTIPKIPNRVPSPLPPANRTR
ncbi:MAG: diheme cytochrome c-553 [Acidobacteria bacterium]|nr:MAG: diheme cytochrome c-553 [Acidobacteriota bacterium]